MTWPSKKQVERMMREHVAKRKKERDIREHFYKEAALKREQEVRQQQAAEDAAKPLWRRALNKAQDFVREPDVKRVIKAGGKLVEVAAHVGQAQLKGPLSIATAGIGLINVLVDYDENNDGDIGDPVRKHAAKHGLTTSHDGAHVLPYILSNLGMFNFAEVLHHDQNQGSFIKAKIPGTDGFAAVVLERDGSIDGDWKVYLSDGMTSAHLSAAIWLLVNSDAVVVTYSDKPYSQGGGLSISPIVDYGENEYIGPQSPEDFVAKFRRYQEHGVRRAYLAEGPPGTGKCLGEGTPVLLYDGRVVPVEDVKVGDLLMGPDSQPRRVLSTTVGHGPLYLVQPVKGASWVCNDAHVLTVKNTDTKKISDIPLNEFIAKSKRFQERSKLFRVGVDFPPRPPRGDTSYKDIRTTGFKVEPIGPGTYYGFTLDGDGRFLLGDFTVTHNTTFAFKCAQLLGGRTLVVTPDLLNQNGISLVALAELIASFRPSMLLFDDVDRVDNDDVLLSMMDMISKTCPDTLQMSTANNPRSITRALRRPSRLGQRITFPAPDLEWRKKVIVLYTKQLGVGRDLSHLADLMEHDRFTHDYIKDVVEQALVEDDAALASHIERTISDFEDDFDEQHVSKFQPGPIGLKRRR